MTLDFTQIEVLHLITHHIGNKLRDEKYKLSSEETIIADETKGFLLKYFLQPFKPEDFFAFYHTVDLSMNEVNVIVNDIFNNSDSFIKLSSDLAKLLYEQSMHPKIKGGELNVVHFSKVTLDNELVDAVGIFKSETNVPFLKMEPYDSRFKINHEYGFEIRGMDKGCIIFNVNSDTGFKILNVDNSSKFLEAQYWKNDFLQIKPLSDEFHQTNQFLSLAKQFVTKQLSEDIQVTKADQIDLLNRSVEYFKTRETFSKEEFEEEVFSDPNLIGSFRKFGDAYYQENELNVSDNFDISARAVKKQARAFKSVLKLDRNFDIYIHGNRELIEKGVDEKGRKFYKIFYEEEK